MIALQQVDEMVRRQVPLPCLDGCAEIHFHAAPAIGSLAPEKQLLATFVVTEHGSNGDDLEVARVNLPPRHEIRLQLSKPALAGNLVLFAAAHVVAHGAECAGAAEVRRN
jgi:hypothetical protein